MHRQREYIGIPIATTLRFAPTFHRLYADTYIYIIYTTKIKYSQDGMTVSEKAQLASVRKVLHASYSS